MPSPCYLCAKPGSIPLKLKESFTAHSLAKCPDSKTLCDRCYGAIDGTEKQLWYWNEGKGKWSALWGRSLSRLYQGEKLIAPVIEGQHTESGKTFQVVSNLPTRVQMREWLLNPPEPPFTIVISESGQKHLVPFAQEAYSKEGFPVLFEMDLVYIDRRFHDALGHFESLMGIGFGKTEILTGEYRSENLKNNLADWFGLENAIEQYRGSRLFELVAHVAQAPEKKEEAPKQTKAAPEIKAGQLSLF